MKVLSSHLNTACTLYRKLIIIHPTSKRCAFHVSLNHFHHDIMPQCILNKEKESASMLHIYFYNQDENSSSTMLCNKTESSWREWWKQVLAQGNAYQGWMLHVSWNAVPGRAEVADSDYSRESMRKVRFPEHLALMHMPRKLYPESKTIARTLLCLEIPWVE